MPPRDENVPPPTATEAVLVPSMEMPRDATEVDGIDFNKFHDKPVTAEDLFDGMENMGFQSSSLCEAVRIINEMRTWSDATVSPPAKTTIFLGYTSNLISSGLRSVLRYLVQHSHVSAIVTTAGGVEEDIIKCLGPTYLSSFSADGTDLRRKGLNRIGNLVIPNANYCAFEDWIIPILDAMLDEQEQEAASRRERWRRDEDRHEILTLWTPSKIISRLGAEISKHPDHESSVLYWAHKNNIPIFCPALTDGSLGDMLYFHTFRSYPRRLVVDIVDDIRKINSMSVSATRAGMIILGGGLVKHHIANACLMRNGADYAVYINTAQEFDGSDAGARPDEAVSWGKIKPGARSVKVFLEATVAFPFIVANTFAKVPKERDMDKNGAAGRGST